MNMNRVPKIRLTKKTLANIDELVELYKKEIDRFNTSAKQVYTLLSEHKKLTPYIHSLKYRVKDPEHLRLKLINKAIACKRKKKEFGINNRNLFKNIDDLVGVRLLHLNTRQMGDINKALLEIFEEEKYNLIDGPTANTWDNEYRDFFEKLSMKISQRETLYTSVHYIIGTNNKYQTRCEIQVRTLMEEVWGEVSHKINYPKPTGIICCEEQIKVLARATSSCTRLVDSIFKSHKEHSG